MAITGCLINKYTKKIVVDQPTSNQLLFKIGAYVFIILISLSTLYCVVESIYDLIYFPIAKSAIVNANGADITTSSFDVYYIYPQIIKFTLLVILLGVVYCP
jgi:hypothetical protein